MKINYLCPYWGQDNVSAEEFVNKVIEANYSGAEINIPENVGFEKDLLKTINRKNFLFIAQQWLPPANESFDAYRTRFNNRLKFLVDLNPVFINSHTGKDFFSFDENCVLLEDCFEITNKTGIRIVHETHRGRFPFSAYLTKQYIERFPELELNADFTHWCTVSESMLEDQAESLQSAIKHSSYIHGRIGHTQTPQIPNPFDEEWTKVLDTFVGWWKRIIENAKQNGKDEFYVCPEFGPEPYMPNEFNTKTPVANQWELNVNMMKHLKKVLL